MLQFLVMEVGVRRYLIVQILNKTLDRELRCTFRVTVGEA
jgi:hypothetical protein